MEDKRTALAVVLCLLVVMFYSEMFLKPNAPVVSGKESSTSTPLEKSSPMGVVGKEVPASSLSTTQAQGAPILPQELAPSGQQVLPTTDEIRAKGLVEIESSVFKARLSLLGSRLFSFRLTEHKKSLNSERGLELVHHQEGAPYPLGVAVGPLSDQATNYVLKFASTEPVDGLYSVPETGELTLVFEGELSAGRTIEKTFRFRPGSYLFDVSVKLSAAVPGSTGIALDWTEHVATERQGSTYDPFAFAVLTKPDELEHVPVMNLEGTTRAFSDVRWLAMGDKYFGATLVAPQTGQGELAQVGDVFSERIKVTEESVANFQVLLGPKDHDMLRALGNDLHRSINLGFFALVSQPLIALLKMFYALVGNWGLAIVLLTLLIKLLFLPLNAVSFRSMKAMQDLKPEMDALRARIKEPAQLNQEVMALYKKKGVNPMGGCLPVVVQIPVFLGLYNGLLNTLELRHAPFALWMQDLSTPEHLDILGVPVPVLILLMGASMFLAQITTPSAMDPIQKKVMLAMPVVFTISFILFPFPSGLVLYWLVNNLISIVQQTALRTDEGMAPLPATLLGSAIIYGVAYIVTLL